MSYEMVIYLIGFNKWKYYYKIFTLINSISLWICLVSDILAANHFALLQFVCCRVAVSSTRSWWSLLERRRRGAGLSHQVRCILVYPTIWETVRAESNNPANGSINRPILIVNDLFLCSFWLCTFTLAVAEGAAMLLPVSIASNEVLLLYPNSYYVKWLNSSLIQGKSASMK